MALAAATDLERLVRREHASPHDILGAHPTDDGVVVRTFRPTATSGRAIPASGDPVELELVHPGGVFEGIVEGAELPLAYQLEVDYGGSGAVTIDDPYRFLPTVGELDLHLVGEGRHEELWTRLGAHMREV
jgi:1,4-alpha-glucan branching enzyme